MAELRDLSDLAYLRAAWVERSIDRRLVTGIDETIHFFFDDTELGQPDHEIGINLIDQAEADAIKPIIVLLDRMLADLGDADSEAFLRHPLWSDIAPAASAALALLKSRGEAVFPPTKEAL